MLAAQAGSGLSAISDSICSSRPRGAFTSMFRLERDLRFDMLGMLPSLRAYYVPA